MSVLVFGLDLSLTATGIAGPLDKATTFKTTYRGPDRLIDLRDKILDDIGRSRRDNRLTATLTTGQIPTHRFPVLVVIEGYAHAARQGNHQLGELGGVVRVALHEHGYTYIEVAPTRLKKFLTGNGGASKLKMLAQAQLRAKLKLDDHNQADALALRWLGQEALGQTSPMAGAQPAIVNEVIDTLPQALLRS